MFIPQDFIQELQDRGGTYTLTWDGSILILKNGDPISIEYYRKTTLLVLRAFSDAMKTANSLACITDNNNVNLLSHENNIFSWHTRWVNLGFQHYKWLVWTSIIGNLGIQFGSTTANPPPCAAYQLGKQERAPKGNSCTDNHDGGSIKVN